MPLDAPARKEVAHPAPINPRAIETGTIQKVLQQDQRPAFFRGNRGATDQVGRQANGVDGASIEFSPEGCGDLPYPATQAFNDGSAAIGTGPFLLESFRRGEGVDLVRNPDYWGEPAPWEKVTMKPLTSAGPRVAGPVFF